MRSRTPWTLLVGVTAVAALALTGCGRAVDAADDDTPPTATVVEVDAGLVYLVDGDTAIRIQQPRAATLDELTADGVTMGDEVEHLEVADGAVDSLFVVVPPDGPDARLHLLVDGVLHPVVTGTATADEITARTEAPVELLSSVRPAG